MVDTGHVRHAAQTVALLEEVTEGYDVAAILNTHLHSDHCGGNAAVAARFNAPILVPPGDFEAALAWDESRLSFKETGQCCQRFAPTERLIPGCHLPAPFDRWEIHAAPGHDPASVVLFDALTRVVISADALWENGFGIVFPELQRRDAFSEVEASLDLIESLRPTSVIPGHGAPFTDVETALSRARARLTHFRREPRRHALHAAKALMVFKVMESGALSREELARWAGRTPIFARIRDLADARGNGSGRPNESAVADWVDPLIQDLLSAGSLRVAVNAAEPDLLKAG